MVHPLFLQMLEAQKVPQSLLLIGAGIEDALALVKRLFGPSNEAKIDQGNHPDLHILIPEEKSGLHPVASIHDIIQEMALPPFETCCKIFILVQSESMLPSASNALLKTLEEPNEDTYFFLLSDHPERLLPTIRSRLHPLFFKGRNEQGADLEGWLSLVQRGEWDQILDLLSEEPPEAFLGGVLQWAAQLQYPLFFQKVSSFVEEGELALEHNLKPRTVFLTLLVKISAIFRPSLALSAK